MTLTWREAHRVTIYEEFKMKTRTLLLSTLLTAFLTLTTSAQADSHTNNTAQYDKSFDSSKHDKRRQKRLARMAEKLGLSEQQKVQVNTLRQNHRNEAKPLRTEKRALRKELHKLDPNDATYAAKLADIANRQAAVERQLIILKGNKRQQMSRILTPEQMAKRKEMHAKRKRHQKKKHRRNQY